MSNATNATGAASTAPLPAWFTGPFLQVWLPGAIGILMLLALRGWVAKKLGWNLMLKRLVLAHMDGRAELSHQRAEKSLEAAKQEVFAAKLSGASNRLHEALASERDASHEVAEAKERALEAARAWGHKVREILKNTLLTETVMNTLGLSIAIAFLHWGADLDFEEHETIFGHWYAFFAFASSGGFTTAMCINLLGLCYLDVMLDENIPKVLSVDNSFAAKLIVDPVLTFFTACLFLIFDMVLFQMKVFGEAAAIGCSICMLGPLGKIVHTWIMLDRNTIERQAEIDTGAQQKKLERSKKIASVSTCTASPLALRTSIFRRSTGKLPIPKMDTGDESQASTTSAATTRPDFT